MLSAGPTLSSARSAPRGPGALPHQVQRLDLHRPEPRASRGTLDYWRWGPGYWWQNTRLPYMSMCTSGDFELMARCSGCMAASPGARQGADDATRARGRLSRRVHNFWGPAFNETYGWTPREKRDVKVKRAAGINGNSGRAGARRMMLDYYEHTGDEALLKEHAHPLHPRDPTSSRLALPRRRAREDRDVSGAGLETWWEARTRCPRWPGPGRDGRLRHWPGRPALAERKALWRAPCKMPALPTRSRAESACCRGRTDANRQNIENPELYAVFPFRRLAIGRPDIELAIEALQPPAGPREFRLAAGRRLHGLPRACRPGREYLVGRARKGTRTHASPRSGARTTTGSPTRTTAASCSRPFRRCSSRPTGRRSTCAGLARGLGCGLQGSRALSDGP